MRAIDADEVTRGIKQQFCTVCDNCTGIRCRDCDVAECMRMIDGTNTIGAEPVKPETAEPSTTAPDNVNHPSHYETNGIECIDAMEAAQDVSAVQNFCICNAFKYIWRYKHKNGAEDIKKAVWYLNKWLELERRDK